MMADTAYGLWPLVILNTALFAIFAISFPTPAPGGTGARWAVDAATQRLEPEPKDLATETV
jgi:hypothetical protein